MDLFTYGSLMLPQVWEAVTGKPHPPVPGTLTGHVRRTVAGATFPGILRSDDQTATVDGAIYRDVDEHSLALLDDFESDFYIRQKLTIQLANKSSITCGAYVVPPENAHLLSDEPWDLATFEKEHLQTFLGRNFHHD